MNSLRRAVSGLQLAAEILIGLMLGAMIVIVFAQTFFRYVIFASLPWSEELSRFLFVAMIALGINIGISRDMMVRIDIIDNKLGHRGAKVMSMVRHCIGIFMNVFFAYSTFDLISIGAKQASPALGLPMSVMYGTLLVGFVLAVVASVLKIVDLVGNQPQEVAA